MTEQSDDSAFSQAHIRSRSIQKVAKTLPKSPRKRKEVISALANKFKLRIKPTQSKAGRPKNELTESEKEWIKNYLDKTDIIYVTPGRKNHHYVGKVDGKSQYVQKRYLMWILNDSLNIANGSSLIKNESSFEFSFGKKIKFHQLYEYIKSNREYVYNRDIPQSSYFCKICKNVCFVATALNKKIKSCNMVPTDPHSLAEKYTCDFSSSTYMFSENECCYFTGVIMEEFLNDCDDVEYYEWAKVDGKVKKVVKSVDVEEAIELFNEQVKILKAYIFVKRTQNTHYNLLKENLKTNEFIIHVDYSESYKDEQDEIQIAYFEHN